MIDPASPNNQADASELTDSQIAAALRDVVSPTAPVDLADRVMVRVHARRRRLQVIGGAATALLLASAAWWTIEFSNSQRPSPDQIAAASASNPDSLESDWNTLLDEIAASPSPFVDLKVNRHQRAWTTALETVTRK